MLSWSYGQMYQSPSFLMWWINVHDSMYIILRMILHNSFSSILAWNRVYGNLLFIKLFLYHCVLLMYICCTVESPKLRKWDVIKRWLGLRVPEIPFPRTSILKIWAGKFQHKLKAQMHTDHKFISYINFCCLCSVFPCSGTKVMECNLDRKVSNFLVI